MNNGSDSINAAAAWYASPGQFNDVILSTRARLVRNLANFPFPEDFRDDDSERVQTLVFDSFSHCSTPENFQAVSTENLDPLGLKILSERGITDTNGGTGIILRADGKVSCTVNSRDHLRISAFIPGLDCNGAYAMCRSVDEELQQSMQFAASYDFGYLTSSLDDAGSGLKLSMRVHLPSLSFLNRIEPLINFAASKGLSVSAAFGAGDRPGTSLGQYYQISTVSAMTGNELDQITTITAMGKYLYETETAAREECRKNESTSLWDRISRSYAASRFGKLLPLREAVEIVSGVKWGLDLGYLSGTSDADLFALLYRIQEGHLEFVLKNGTFSFEKDIEKQKDLRVMRLRALITQESLSTINFVA
ncbi:MAG: hypothetical protein LKF96_06445 [Treponema sp.]|jgi:protein arginine kinase|nr:hypothetical protein [Treponema sp.]